MKKLWIALAFAGVISPAWAAMRTVTLFVPGMTCAFCPITVREALSRVKGVRRIRVDFPKRTVRVTYNDAKTTVADLTRATAEAGYRSIAKEQSGDRTTTSARVSGGQIAISVQGRNAVELASNRFTCGSCARRVIAQMKALRGVSGIRFNRSVGISAHGSAANGFIGVLTVTFDPTKVTVQQIAGAARSALEADPYNHSRVALLYQRQSA